MLERVDETRRRHHFETLVDADEEFRRHGRDLDGAELRAFDLPRDRAELACRIDLALDTPAGIFLDQGSKILGKLMRRIVDGRQRDLHHEGLVLRLRGAERQRQCNSQGRYAYGSHRTRINCTIPRLHLLLPLTRPRLKQTYRNTAGFFPKKSTRWH